METKLGVKLRASLPSLLSHLSRLFLQESSRSKVYLVLFDRQGNEVVHVLLLNCIQLLSNLRIHSCILATSHQRTLSPRLLAHENKSVIGGDVLSNVIFSSNDAIHEASHKGSMQVYLRKDSTLHL